MLLITLLFNTFLLIEPLVGLLDQINFKYIYNGDSPNCYQEADPGPPFYLQHFLEATYIILFLTVTFISFVVVLVRLWKRKSVSLSRRNSGTAPTKLVEASITVSIFTGLFLVTNLPLFINVVLYSITNTYFDYSGHMLSTFYMKYYSWVIAKVVCVALNACLNPLVYVLRMKDFQSWIVAEVDKIKRLRQQSGLS